MAIAGLSPAPWGQPQAAVLSGERLHLQHGPIDLVIGVEGESAERRQAYHAAHQRFQSVLGELVGALTILRQPLPGTGEQAPVLASPIARRMVAGCWPHRRIFITPMAAVAGAVADEILAAMLVAAPNVQTAYVNNGGDIALHVADGRELKIGVVRDLLRAVPEGVISVTPESGIGGIATSSWRGRSFSLGIADAVTVLARTAAAADAAATLIANAVNADDPAISRRPARALDADSDLGERLVTTAVGSLSDMTCAEALAAGLAETDRQLNAKHILGAMLALQGHWVCRP